MTVREVIEMLEKIDQDLSMTDGFGCKVNGYEITTTCVNDKIRTEISLSSINEEDSDNVPHETTPNPVATD